MWPVAATPESRSRPAPTRGLPRLVGDGERWILRLDLAAGARPRVEVRDGRLEVDTGAEVVRVPLAGGVTAGDVEATSYRGALEISLPRTDGPPPLARVGARRG